MTDMNLNLHFEQGKLQKTVCICNKCFLPTLSLTKNSRNHFSRHRVPHSVMLNHF